MGPNRVVDRGQAGFESVVQAGELVTWYRRAGKGTPLLLLSRADRDARDVLFSRLVAEFLVIEPEVVPDGASWPQWLAGVVDGLGLSRPLLMIDGADAAAAVRFSREDPERVGGILSSEGIDR